MTVGIYAIVCDKTWRAYVGQSSNLEKRKRQHFSDLKNNNCINPEMQMDYNLYGKDSFFFEVLEKTTEEQLYSREKFWIKFGCYLYNKENKDLYLELSDKDKQRLLNKISIKDDSECWEWNGCGSSKGYGNFAIYIDNKFRNIKPHRAMYFLNNPSLNQDVIIRHKCNNRKCCNPNHLCHGSFRDNARDRYLNNQYKVSNDDVKLLRQKILESPNILPQDLTDWFKEITGKICNKCFLIEIAMNKRFIDFNFIPPKRNMNKLSDEMISRIRYWISIGLEYNKILQFFKDEFSITINKPLISNIKNNKRYKEK